MSFTLIPSFPAPLAFLPYLSLFVAWTQKPINKRTSTLLHAFHAFDERQLDGRRGAKGVISPYAGVPLRLPLIFSPYEVYFRTVIS